MEILLYILAAVVYLSGFYLHRIVYRALAVIACAPTGAIWLLSILWPLLDSYIAIAIACGAYTFREKNAN